MIINTKFDMFQEVWFMEDNAPKKGIVEAVMPHWIDSDSKGNTVIQGENRYSIRRDYITEKGKRKSKPFDESEIFASKKELLDSFLQD